MKELKCFRCGNKDLIPIGAEVEEIRGKPINQITEFECNECHFITRIFENMPLDPVISKDFELSTRRKI